MTLSRGKPLDRRTGLQRSAFKTAGDAPFSSLRTSPLPRSVPFRSVPGDKSAARTRGSATGSLVAPPPAEFSKKVKALVRKRAGNGDPFEAMCEAGGEFLGYYGGEFQHRAARGAGGCRDEVVNGCANCCLLCPRCHRRAEARLPYMGMKWGGFWLEHGTTPEYDPRLVPILLASPHRSGIKVWLAADGVGENGTGYLFQAPEKAAAS